MQTHNLFHAPVLYALRHMTSLLGPKLLESVPTADEITAFFHKLQSCSDQPLSERLLFNPADSSVFLIHRAGSTYIRLATTTHDYTDHGRNDFRDSWTHSLRVCDPDLIPIVMPLFDPCQTHLMSVRPTYLHAIYSHDETLHDRLFQVITVHTAYRYATHREPPPPPTQCSEEWAPLIQPPPLRPATPAEATVWAISHLSPPTTKYDQLRLSHIRTTLHSILDHIPARRIIHPGNSLALIAARDHNSSLNYGRVRHPILAAAMADCSLIRHKVGHKFRLGAEEPPVYFPFQDPFSNLRTPKYLRITISLVFFAIFLGLAIHYTFFRTVSTLIRITLWVVTSIVLFELFVVVFFSPWTRRPKPMSGTRMQVEAATSPLARQAFDGAWLSFCDRTYSGKLEYDGPRFSVSNLLNAGYETSFAMDGREALITPRGIAMRLAGLGRGKNGTYGIFEMAESSSSQVSFGVVDGVRGSWSADVQVGRTADSSDDHFS